MAVLRIVLTVVLVAVCIAMTVLILSQEGKSSGLSGSIAGGSTETYVAQNRGRTPEGKMEKWTKILIAAFLVLALALNILN